MLMNLVSCSQNPDPAVSYIPAQGSNNLDSGKSEITVLYNGSDFFNKSCNLELSTYENFDNKWKASLKYLLHGSDLPEADVEFNEDKNSFIAVALKDGSYGDYESLNDYQASGDLLYFIEIQMKQGFDFFSFTRSLDLLSTDSVDLSDVSGSLDHINRIVFKKWHVSHYDAGGCLKYSLNGIVGK